jgi:hypothetical protein
VQARPQATDSTDGASNSRGAALAARVVVERQARRILAEQVETVRSVVAVVVVEMLP